MTEKFDELFVKSVGCSIEQYFEEIEQHCEEIEEIDVCDHSSVAVGDYFYYCEECFQVLPSDELELEHVSEITVPTDHYGKMDQRSKQINALAKTISQVQGTTDVNQRTKEKLDNIVDTFKADFPTVDLGTVTRQEVKTFLKKKTFPTTHLTIIWLKITNRSTVFLTNAQYAEVFKHWQEKKKTKKRVVVKSFVEKLLFPAS